MIEAEEAMMEGTNQMDCAQNSKISFTNWIVRGPEGAQLREVALVHAESCGRCGALLTETESLDFALLKIADESQRNAAPARMEAGLFRNSGGSKAVVKAAVAKANGGDRSGGRAVPGAGTFVAAHRTSRPAAQEAASQRF